jgi:hypothetical protein
LARKSKIELLNPDGDVCSLLFSHSRTQRACRLLVEELRARDGLTRSEFSGWTWALHRGEVEEGFRFSRTEFYRQVRRVLLTLGLVAIERRVVQKEDFELKSDCVKEKYVLVWQPVAVRPPDGVNLPRLCWVICKKWNEGLKTV